ncbi:MAG: hypothetical protein J2P57_09045 [Acidimicrobiaceae bacterium]|nr:hypothetical protein [Acidimicrobiaceae bacterium]
MKLRRKLGALVAASSALGGMAAAGVLQSTAAPAAAAPGTPTISTGCNLGNGVKHVIEITFDNVHVFRDNPNVLSDIEQMPALMNFMTSQGTLFTNDHTPLIAHTADDIMTNLTGLYGDRQGIPIANSYEVYQPSGQVVSKSAFAYWTGTYGVDAYPNQPYSPVVPATGQPPKTVPAPWVPFTRAGCNVGGVSTANIELENLNPDLANVFGANSPEVQQLNADPDSFKDQEVNDYEGLAVHCAQQATFCSSARAVKFNQTSPSPTAAPDVLPDEPGGYNGFQGLFGSKYLTPQLAAAANAPGGVRDVNGHSYPVTDANGALTDLNGKEIDGQFAHTPGFPGFGPISAAQSLAYVADMQETGVPVTYAYISDIHEQKPGQTGCSNSGTAQGPADACDKANAAAYNQAFAEFFQRLADDGINASNTEFVFAADEGDHFSGANVGRAVTPSCTGTPDTTAYTCNYTPGTIGEESLNIHGLLQAQQGNTTPFYNEPQGNAVYITGNPSPTSTETRNLERAFGQATANDTFDGNVPEKVAQYMADPTTEQLLHFVNADPNRTPSFDMFPKPDFFLSGGTSDSCPAGTTAANAATQCTSVNNGFAWNHGFYAPEINTTWFGMVGPGVKHLGIDGPTPAQGPNSSGTANSNPVTDTSLRLPGTWVDHTDIRPTLLALTGLKDDYIDDGRVVTEALTVHPGDTSSPLYQPLAACYKQLNASVGIFGTNVLLADTKALKTGSASSDARYRSVMAQIKALGALRDRVATAIKDDLYATAFNDRRLPQSAIGQLAACGAILLGSGHLAQR